jgi:hypothetical protein
MKNYIIGTLMVVVLVLSSLLYKTSITSIGKKFPVLENPKNFDAEVPLFLYVFLSKKNCIDCMEFIKTLNNLPSHFMVTGIVPKNELKDEEELRNLTGAQFPLIYAEECKKDIPFYTPSIVGVSPKRDIIFVLPGVPVKESYLVDFLDSLYSKIYPVLIKEKFAEQENKTETK